MILGSIGAADVQAILRGYLQRERNSLFRAVLDELVPGASITSARLGTASFSVVGPRGVVVRLDALRNPEGLIQDALRRRAAFRRQARR